jgi:membrane protein required for colicin V production
MNAFDVIFFVALAYGLIRGLIKGFVVEVSGMIALILGVFGAFKFSSLLGNFLIDYVNWEPKIIQIVSFILLFIGIIYCISLLAKMLTKALQIVALGLLNRFAGGLFGVLKWITILCVFTLIYKEVNTIVTLMPKTVLKESIFYPFLSDLGSILFDWVLNNETIQNQTII